MDETYALILEIRRAFADLRAHSDRLNAAQGITAARRAVMEHLSAHGPATVPQIAEVKQVTRQHVQTVADELTARGLTAFRDNPAHKRSHFLDLTEDGRATFAAIREKETELLARVSEAMPPDTAAQGRAALRTFRAALARLVADG